MAIEDIFKTNRATVIGLGIVTLAVPLIFPALRPQFAAVLKAGAKLFLEAEFEADDAVAEQVVDACIGHLLQALSAGSEEERKRAADTHVEHFAGRARRRARRRGWNEQDAKARYHRYMKKFEHRIAGAHRKAAPAQRAALAHAAQRVSEHRAKAQPGEDHERASASTRSAVGGTNE
jgi:hypothetical protein